MADDLLDMGEVRGLVESFNAEGQRVRRRNEAAVRAGIDHVYGKAIADAEQWKDTGAMIAATKKVGRGYVRAVICNDPAGMMNEYGNHGRPPRPWLIIHGDAGAKVVEEHMGRAADEFFR